MQIDWWLQPRAVFDNIFRGTILGGGGLRDIREKVNPNPQPPTNRALDPVGMQAQYHINWSIMNKNTEIWPISSVSFFDQNVVGGVCVER